MPASTLECLPVELLEPIFKLSSHNVALLQASCSIGIKLSNIHIYNSVCDRYLGEVLERRIEYAAAQTLLLASRWMIWAFLKSWIIRAYGPSGCLCGFTEEQGCFDAQWPPDFEDPTNTARSHLTRLAFVNARIPKKLLRGPWIDDNVQFLRFILWTTSMTVDWKSYEMYQAAMEGRKRAILEGNLEAVKLFNHNRRLGNFASMDTVRFAVLEAGCNRSIVYEIIVTANMWRPGLAWKCAELDKWCDDRIAYRDAKGSWLRVLLAELRANERSEKSSSNDDTGYKPYKPIELDPEMGKYDGGADDMLFVKNLK